MEKEKYIVIIEHFDKQLVKTVNDKITEGYEPHGNVAIAFDQAGNIKNYVQIMVLKEEYQPSLL